MSEIAVLLPDPRGRVKTELDPHAVLDYTWDWQKWLANDSDHIIECNVTGEECTINAFSHDGRYVTAWVSGGTAGITARAVCHIRTAEGREDDRSIIFKVKER